MAYVVRRPSETRRLGANETRTTATPARTARGQGVGPVMLKMLGLAKRTDAQRKVFADRRAAAAGKKADAAKKTDKTPATPKK